MASGRQRVVLAWAGIVVAGCVPLFGQSPVQIVQQAVQTELAAANTDRSHWRFRQEEKLPMETVSVVVQTAYGTLKEKVEENGHPLSTKAAAAERSRVEASIHDTALHRKQRRESEHDDESAAKLLAMLPNAFTWKVGHESPEFITLLFAPNPAFQPPDMESRVMGAMAGELVVDRAQHRIRTMRGTLAHEVDIGYGILGKMRQGGTFDVERREIASNLWQIVETHVHIDGRALFFKTIGEQEDEVNTGYSRVPDITTLDQAVALLASPQTASVRAAR